MTTAHYSIKMENLWIKVVSAYTSSDCYFFNVTVYNETDMRVFVVEKSSTIRHMLEMRCSDYVVLVNVITVGKKIHHHSGSLAYINAGAFQDDATHTESLPPLAMILSNKRSVLMTGENIQRELKDLVADMIVPGCVKKITDHGLIIDLYNKNEGFAPNKYLFDRHIPFPSRLFRVGQSVMAKVVQKNPTRDQVDVKLRLSQCKHAYRDSGVDAMMDYVKYYTGVLEKQNASQSKDAPCKIGAVVKVTITTVKQDRCEGKLEDGTKVIINKDHMTGVSPKVNEECEGVALYVDIKANQVEVSLKKSLVEDVKQLCDTKYTKVSASQCMDCEVALVHDTFVLVFLKGAARGRHAFIPARSHLNDFVGPRQFIIGQSNKIVIKNVDNGLILAHLTKKGKEELVKKLDKSEKEECVPQAEVKTIAISGTAAEVKIAVGGTYTAKIKGVRHQHLVVTVEGIRGRVHVSELMDTIKSQGMLPLPKYKGRDSMKVKVVKIEDQPSASGAISKQMSAFLECSAKPSVIASDDLSIALPEVGSECPVFVTEVRSDKLIVQYNYCSSGVVYLHDATVSATVLKSHRGHFKIGQGYKGKVTAVSQTETRFSFSGDNVLKANNLVLARVQEVKNSMLLLDLPNGMLGRVALCDLFDTYQSNPTSKFTLGQYVEGRLLKVKKKGRCEVSLRASRVKSSLGKKTSAKQDSEISSLSSLKKNTVLRGYVSEIRNNLVVVQLSRDIVGHVGFAHTTLCNTEAEARAAFAVGQVVTAKVIELKPDHAQLSLLQKHTDIPERQSKGGKKRKAEEELEESLPAKRSMVALAEDADSGVEVKEEEEEEEEESESESEEESEKSDTVGGHLKLGAAFSWDNSLDVLAATPGGKQQSDSDDDDDEQDKKPVRGNRTRNRAERLAEKNAAEKRLYALEQAAISGDAAQPETAEQFDRMVLQSPDSSIVWLRYMAFHLETTEIEKARAVAERALKTISFREEQEKLNVWVAYMNLENMYGSPEALKEVFDRALQQNDQLSVYQQLVTVYVQSQKIEEADRLYSGMVKKFSQNLSVWISYGTFFYRNTKADMARKLMTRALNCLEKKQHLELLSKFAQLEFKYGEPERGKTMFENILSSYSKRTDLWSVYIDMVTRLADLDAVRQLYERTINLNLVPKKMKFFFKKYLEFEQKFGTEESTANVKRKAVDYVESKTEIMS